MLVLGGGDVEQGPDPQVNLRLRSLLHKARLMDMPKKNVENAFKKVEGKQSDDMTDVIYSGYGPNGVAVIIEAITSNRNRTVKEIRSILTRAGGSISDVLWMFDKKGCIEFKCNDVSDNADDKEYEHVYDMALSIGAHDVQHQASSYSYQMIVDLNELSSKSQQLQSITDKYQITNIYPVYIPNSHSSVVHNNEGDDQVIDEFMNELEQLDDVLRIHSNLRSSSE